MFRSVLIANRGEIAVRVIRAARALGMRAIAVYSEADRDALHVRLADEAHLLGPAAARDSYLDLMRVIEIGRRTKAECLHPGYGFLAERPELVEACRAAGIAFVGPPAAAMQAMGIKSDAKRLMAKAKVPVVPGYYGGNEDLKFLRQKAYEIGYPVLVKAVAGGGGRGMRKVEKAIDFDAAVEAASREADAAFGDGRIMIEKYIADPRHIEVQILADFHGHVVHLFERDCSLQRRHQKVIEEAPAPGMTAELREALGQAAVHAARSVGYAGAGTVEFLVDAARPTKDHFWFLEMNTRLQVEHPVTEAVCDVDLVAWQFRIAAGEKITLRQNEIRLDGHAVEARLYAEDPDRGFLPSTGRLHALRLPSGEGIRVDRGVEVGDEVTPYYDAMIAKIIAHGRTREAALNRLAKALAETVVVGPRTNIAFLSTLVGLPDVRQARVDTGLIDRWLLAEGRAARGADRAAAARATERLLTRERARLARRAKTRSNERHSIWERVDGDLPPAASPARVAVSVDGERTEAEVRYDSGGPQATIDGEASVDCILIELPDAVIAWRDGRQNWVTLAETDSALQAELSAGDGAVRAPMHGKVLSLAVELGVKVRRGQRLIVLEAMKMEHTLLAPIDGTVTELTVSQGDQVAEGARLVMILPTD